MPIRGLPIDLFLSVFRFLNITDVLIFRQVCRPFNEISRLKSAWHILYRTQILERDIPFIVGSSGWFESISSRELERLVKRAIVARRNWASEVPRFTRRIDIQTSDITRAPAQQRVIKELQLFHRGSHPYLLSATLNDYAASQLLAIECWDLKRKPFCIARKHGYWGGGILFNADPSFPPSVAIQGHNEYGIPPITVMDSLTSQHLSVQILTLSCTAQSFNSTFTPVARLPLRISRLLAFSGKMLISMESNGRVFIYDTNRANHRAEIVSPSLPPSPSPLSLSNLVQSGQTHQQSDVHQGIVTEEYLVLLRSRYIAFYALRDFRHGPTSLHGTIQPAVYHVWQWPIESGRIAQCVSHRATRANMEQPLNIVVRYAATILPWSVSQLNHYILHPNLEYLPHLGVSVDNVPFEVSPVPVHILYAPLRISVPTDLVIGEYSTVLWLDTHTESYYGHVMSGQRLVGRVLTEHQTSVFNVHVSDVWQRLAIDEQCYRIAIGAHDGRVTVMDYA